MQYLDFCAAPERYSFTPVTADAIYYVVADQSYRISHPPIPDSHVLCATLQGSGILAPGCGTIRAEAGDLVLFDASKGRFHYRCAAAGWNFWWFEFRCLQPGFPELPAGCALHIPLEEFHRTLCSEALASLKLNDVRAASSLLSSLLCLLSRREGSAAVMPREAELFRRADQYIRHSIATVTVQSTARYLGICEHTLLNLFRTLLGIRTIDYIQKIRIEMACHQLSTGDSSIRDISLQLGYSDPFTFSKSFRRHMGMSPTEYRKQAGYGS